MRGPISDVELPFVSAARVRAKVPGMLLDDELFMSLCAAFDDLLAPAVAALDCFPAYLDPRLAPDDFLGWLGSLVGASTGRAGAATDRDAIAGAATDRDAIAGAVASYGTRGTAAGLRLCAAASAGVPVGSVEVEDPGGVTWSRTPGTASVPSSGSARLRITVPEGVDAAAVAAAVQDAVESVRPVHCAFQIEVV